MIRTTGGLKQLIKQQIKGQEYALDHDDPKRTCAASHRGAIRALKYILSQIPESIKK